MKPNSNHFTPAAIAERIRRKQGVNRQGGDGKIMRYLLRRAAKLGFAVPTGFLRAIRSHQLLLT